MVLVVHDRIRLYHSGQVREKCEVWPGFALEILAGFGSQLLTRLRRTTNDENFGFQPGLGINGLPGFSGESEDGMSTGPRKASGSNC
jgi:hypothetical protein